MSRNFASETLERFCHETGRTVPQTIQVATFDFTPGSNDRKAFEEWARDDREWKRERWQFGHPSEKAKAAGWTPEKNWPPLRRICGPPLVIIIR